MSAHKPEATRLLDNHVRVRFSLLRFANSFPMDRSGHWGLDILHANGVRAYQPRATALGGPSRNPNPPCKGGSNLNPEANATARVTRALAGRTSPIRPPFPGWYPGRVWPMKNSQNIPEEPLFFALRTAR
jgi:hypothetical protein